MTQLLSPELNSVFKAKLQGDGLAPLLEAVLNLVIKPASEAKRAFILHLVGDLGTGKTYFVGQLLHFLGLPEFVPVTSPTFTYLTEYELQGLYYAHIDAYRSLAAFDWDLQIDAREYAGFFVEWPERFSTLNLNSPFKFCLKIDYLKEGLEFRNYSLIQLP